MGGGFVWGCGFGEFVEGVGFWVDEILGWIVILRVFEGDDVC